jgi:hypothetical protein
MPFDWSTALPLGPHFRAIFGGLMLTKPIYAPVRSAILIAISLFGVNQAVASAVWSPSTEVSYLLKLAASEDFFRTENTFISVVERLSSTEYRTTTVARDDFFLFVQSSPDNGVFRGFYADKCGEQFCLRLEVKNYKTVQILNKPIPLPGLNCPTSPLFGVYDKKHQIRLSLGNTSNYIVCRQGNDIRRFGASGGKAFSMDRYDDIPATLNIYFKGLFSISPAD